AQSEAGDPKPALVACERSARTPLSYAQERLWFIDQLQQGKSTEYNMPGALLLSGDLDAEAFGLAIQALVKRHETLRTHFVASDGEPFQVIEPELSVPLPVQDLSALDEASRTAAVATALRREGSESFDLARGPLLRVRLLMLADGPLQKRQHILLRTVHHIVSDGWSEGVFNRELAALYEAYSLKRPSTLPPLTVQYADFSLWQRSWLDKTAISRGLEYWTTQLAGIDERPALPTDRPRPAVQTFAADYCHRSLGAAQLAALQELSNSRQATLYMTLLAAFGVLLNRYSGSDDIVLGSP
ncbi:MAG: non-ribosomal peptide synthetase, partial [Delftia sp.]|nr:non-ribosomal peptide synthetase [Delftia sp.]